MKSGSSPSATCSVDACLLGEQRHVLRRFRQRAVDVDRKALERNRPSEIAQILEQPLERRELAIDGAAERRAIVGVVVHLQHQLAVVADVLDRVRDVVHQAGGDAAERRLALLLDRFGLQRDQAIAIRLKASPSCANSSCPSTGTRSSKRPSASARVPRIRPIGRRNERPQNERDCDRGKQREADGQRQEALEADGEGERLRGRLLDHDPPAETRHRLHHGQHRAAVGASYSAQRGARLVPTGRSADGRRDTRRARRAACRRGCRARAAPPFVDEQREASGRCGCDRRAATAPRAAARRRDSRRPAGLIDAQRDHRLGQEVGVDLEVGAIGAARPAGGSAQGQRRRGHPARDCGAPAGRTASARELGERQDVVAQDALLLPALQRGVLQVRGDRLEQVEVVADVALDLLAGASATISAPDVTDWRVPLRSRRIDTKP